MKALVDIESLKILEFNDREITYWGTWAPRQSLGMAVWKDCPAGERTEELKVDASGNVVVDTAIKDARLAREALSATRKASIKAGKSAVSVAGLREIVLAMAREMGFEVDE